MTAMRSLSLNYVHKTHGLLIESIMKVQNATLIIVQMKQARHG